VKTKSIFFFLLIFFFSTVSPKILLITYAFNRPDFIEVQYKTFKKYLRDDYEFIVFNDAKNKKMEMDINNVCDNLAIRCFRIPQAIHSRPYLQRLSFGPFHTYQLPAVRNSNVVQYSLDLLGFKHNDLVAIFDSDLFLIKEFSIREYLKGYNIAGWPRAGYIIPNPSERIKKENRVSAPVFLWIGLVFFDMPAIRNKKLINFNCGIINGFQVDAGGFTHYFLISREAKPKFFDIFRFLNLICLSCESKPPIST